MPPENIHDDKQNQHRSHRQEGRRYENCKSSDGGQPQAIKDD